MLDQIIPADYIFYDQKVHDLAMDLINEAKNTGAETELTPTPISANPPAQTATVSGNVQEATYSVSAGIPVTNTVTAPQGVTVVDANGNPKNDSL